MILGLVRTALSFQLASSLQECPLEPAPQAVFIKAYVRLAARCTTPPNPTTSPSSHQHPDGRTAYFRKVCAACISVHYTCTRTHAPRTRTAWCVMNGPTSPGQVRFRARHTHIRTNYWCGCPTTIPSTCTMRHSGRESRTRCGR